MATSSTVRSSLNGLARRLVADGLLSEADAIKAQRAAVRGKRMLVSQLVEDKLVEPRAMATVASEEFGVPYFDLDAMDMAFAAVKEVDGKLIQRLHALPLYRRGKRLFVAVSDPTHLQALDEMKFHTGINTEPVLVEEDKLARALEVAGESLDDAMTGLVDEDLENIDIGGGEEERQTDITAADVDDAPVVRFVNKILLDAINRGASDVHFEPYERFYRIRFRQDGILHEIAQPPVSLGMRLAARLKVMSRLDIAERRVPQDGRIKLKLSRTRAIDFRVSTCPTLWGEKVVLRILDPSSTRMGIDQLGYEPDQKELYLNALQRPQGMILVTGPTGSGKTVSLYTGLNVLNTADRNISTAEDPAEINLPGVNQVNVNPRVGLTFAAAMRAFLRQDPDVIMVGEVRDLETAEIAIKAAQTGHMVLSTLHTNDAPQTLTRLINMGVAPFNIASSVSLIIAQRLARRLCTHCKEPLDLPRQVLLDAGFREDELDKLKIYGPRGCDQCTEGYRGRVGIYQVLPVSEAIGRIIMEGGNSLQIAEQAKKEGVADLRTSGLRKVRAGITSLEELHRVTLE
ncbi:MAG TPA: type IV-A pilus assembly ATPase PilB [Gammaproteobacteria bacterium]|nr:type IV-A pilus assembly ATPase PilB [Gammaproteobacteria bacterium]